MENPAGEVQEYRFPRVRALTMDAPWRWLRKGLSDLLAAPGASLFYGGVLACMGLVLGRVVSEAAYQLAFVTGFLLVSPYLAMGLYDISRRRENGERVALAATLTAGRANASAIGFYAVVLALLMAVWIRVSVVVVALFFEGSMPGMRTLLADIVASENGMVFLLVYLAAGFGFALLVYATSVVSLPMLLDRSGMDTLTAMITSFNALRLNVAPMLLWSAMIVALIWAGFATFYFGLVVALPLIGHATWHAYRETIEPD